MVFVSNFQYVLFFFSNSIFTNVYIIYINKMHHGNASVVLHLLPLSYLLILLSFFSLCDLYILITFLIWAILLRSKSYFPPCYNALNTQIHSLLGMIFLRGDHIFWHTWSLALEEYVASFHTLQDRPFAQSHRWKISSPWEPFLRCLVQTSPWWSTGLQILVQKWRAQQNPSMQSDDRRQGSPSCPAEMVTKRYYYDTRKKSYFAIRGTYNTFTCTVFHEVIIYDGKSRISITWFSL